MHHTTSTDAVRDRMHAALAAQHAMVRAREDAMRPHAEKLCGQYTQGLMTVDDLMTELLIVTIENSLGPVTIVEVIEH